MVEEKQAIIRGMAYDVDVIRRYLPSNYFAFTFAHDVIIVGIDEGGWTLEDYVIPRLASGLIWATPV